MVIIKIIKIVGDSYNESVFINDDSTTDSVLDAFEEKETNESFIERKHLESELKSISSDIKDYISSTLGETVSLWHDTDKRFKILEEDKKRIVSLLDSKDEIIGVMREEIRFLRSQNENFSVKNESEQH